MLTIKTGMVKEAEIARAYAAPGFSVLNGIHSAADLHKTVPAKCTAIISFGLCGALAPEVQIGQLFVADVLVSPEREYHADAEWGARLLANTMGSRADWWSSGLFNTANDPAERHALFVKTKCAIIDDETLMVAQFAEKRGIPWQAMRVVSDCIACVIPPAAQIALGNNGEWRIGHILKSVLTHPAQMSDLIALARNFYKSLHRLRLAAIQVGPSFQWADSITAEGGPSLRWDRSLAAPTN